MAAGSPERDMVKKCLETSMLGGAKKIPNKVFDMILLKQTEILHQGAGTIYKMMVREKPDNTDLANTASHYMPACRLRIYRS